MNSPLDRGRRCVRNEQAEEHALHGLPAPAVISMRNGGPRDVSHCLQADVGRVVPLTPRCGAVVPRLRAPERCRFWNVQYT
jgi:hypothetical protein